MNAKAILIILVFVLGLVVTPATARAQDDTTTNSAELNRRIRELIEQTSQEKDDQGQGLIGVLGSVAKVGTSTFTLVDSRGRERTIQVADQTKFTSGKKTVTLQDLSINAGAVVAGQALDDIVVEARRVIVSDSAFVETRRILVGTITQWNRRNLTLEARGSHTTESFAVNNRTHYQDNVGTAITAADIQTDQAVLIVVRDDGETHTISTLRLLAPLAR